MTAVSVIIPVYNRAHLISQAIESVLGQSFADFELLVVDDGSTDDTGEVVCSFRDPRVKYLRQQNQGVSAARNTGLKSCQGEFVAFLDSDDIFLPEKLALQLAEFERIPEAGLVYGKYYVTSSVSSPPKLTGNCFPQLDVRRLLLGPVFHWSTTVIRRTWLDRVGGFDESLSIGEEWELTIRLALAGCPMACVPAPVSNVRIQPVSLSREVHLYDPEGRKVLDKTFGDPRLPKDLLDLRDLAYAVGLIRSARSVYFGPHPAQGKEILERALATDPSLAGENLDLLVSKLLNYVTGFSLSDPEGTLATITHHLPGDRVFSRKLKRELWGKYYMQAAIDAYWAGEPLRCWSLMLRAIANTPACLRNRGALSILLRSVLGDKLTDSVLRLNRGTLPS